MKKRIAFLAAGAVCCLALAGAFALTGAQPAQAADYKRIPLSNGKAVVKSGSYYFTVKSDHVYVSTKKTGGFKRTPMEWDRNLLSNGKRVYYAQNNKLYRYKLASRKNAKLKTLKSASYLYNDVSVVYKGDVYITLFSEKAGTWSTYRYDTGSGKYALQYRNCTINTRSGAYAVGQAYEPGDVSPFPITLYKLDGTGMHKVKKLAKFGMSPTFAGGKLYWCAYGSSGGFADMAKTTLYRSNKNGGGKTKIVTLKETSKGAQVVPIKITAKYVNYITGTENFAMYRYTYASGTTTRITSNS